MPYDQESVHEATRINFGTTLLHRLWMWFEDAPHAPIYWAKNQDGKWISFSVQDIVEQIARIAFVFERHKLQPEECVAIYARNCPDWVEWELAIILAGGISVGVHPHLPKNDLGLIFHEIQPRWIIAESDVFIKKLESQVPARTQVFSWVQALQWIQAEVAASAPQQKNWSEYFLKKLNHLRVGTHFLVYTSGTMGRPRGVKLGLEQFSRTSEIISRQWNLPFAEGSLYSFLPLSHVAEKLQVLGIGLTQRYTVWFNSSFDHVINELAEIKPTFLLGVPRFWEKLKENIENLKPIFLEKSHLKVLAPSRWIQGKMDQWYYAQVKPKVGLQNIKIAVSGAAKLSPAVYEWFKKIGITLSEIYGMSETCGLIAITEVGERDDPQTVGKPPLGVEVKIEKNGEIFVRGQHLFFGYYQETDGETDPKMKNEGWLRTGDLGEFTVTGELKIIGRDREIIKLANGRMVAPLPLEDALKELPEVSNACVLGEGKDGLIALLTLKEKVLMEIRFIPGAIEGVSVELVEFKQKLHEKVEDLYLQGKINERIKKIVILSRDFLVEEKEMTPTHKINRSRISQNFSYFLAGS